LRLQNRFRKENRTMKAKEITPKKARCGVAACPGTVKTASGTYLIIGSVPAISKLPANVLKKLGPGEMVVEIPASVLPKMK
jgi:hypothetical protein